MSAYLISLGAGILIGLLGMVLGEQLITGIGHLFGG